MLSLQIKKPENKKERVVMEKGKKRGGNTDARPKRNPS